MTAGAVRVVCGPEAAGGFVLAGLVTVDAATAEDARRSLERLAADPGIGIVLIERRLYDGLGEEARRALGGRPLPLVVPFPGPGPSEGEDVAERYIVDMLRQAIGYSVRLR